MEHNLKIDSEHLIALMAAKKRAEIRENDRNYKIDDILNFYEHGVNCRVTHITNFPDGLKENYVCLSVTVPQAA